MDRLLISIVTIVERNEILKRFIQIRHLFIHIILRYFV
jgi:hypothetical protein